MEKFYCYEIKLIFYGKVKKKLLMILCTGQQRKHRCKEQILDSVGEGEDSMIWETSIETYTLPYVKQITSASLMYGTGHPKSVLCDNLKG